MAVAVIRGAGLYLSHGQAPPVIPFARHPVTPQPVRDRSLDRFPVAANLRITGA